MTEPREPSHPPSDPQPSLARRRASSFAAEDRPLRAPLVAALLLGLLLLASGLYVWHRPHVPGDGASSDGRSGLASDDASGPLDDGGGMRTAVVDAGGVPPSVVVSEVRTLGCHDRGPKHTSPDECDRLAAVEQALSHAVEQAGT